MEEKEIDIDYIPKSLEECYQYLDKFLQDKPFFKDFPEEKVLAITQFMLGRWIRNKWYLWWNTKHYEIAKSQTPEGEEIDYPAEMPELVKWFNSIGVNYGDDMSAIIIISYHKKLNEKSYNLEEDINVIKEFYANQEAENQIKETNKNEKE